MNEIELSDEEKKFWLCRNCECEVINCECGDKQDIFEIPKLELIFGTTSNPANVRYSPMIKKVIVKTVYAELDEDYEMISLKDLGFYISGFKVSRNDIIFWLRRL